MLSPPRRDTTTKNQALHRGRFSTIRCGTGPSYVSLTPCSIRAAAAVAGSVPGGGIPRRVSHVGADRSPKSVCPVRHARGWVSGLWWRVPGGVEGYHSVYDG